MSQTRPSILARNSREFILFAERMRGQIALHNSLQIAGIKPCGIPCRSDAFLPPTIYLHSIRQEQRWPGLWRFTRVTLMRAG